MADRPNLASGGESDSAKVLGIWKLVSLEIEVQGTGQLEPPMGDNPTGYAAFTQEGRAFFILTGDLHEPATNDEQRAGLLNTLVAYTGTYRVEGDKWITKVEVAWNPEWVGALAATRRRTGALRPAFRSRRWGWPNWKITGQKLTS